MMELGTRASAVGRVVAQSPDLNAVHYHYHVQAFTEMNDKDMFVDCVIIEVVAANTEDALVLAKKLVPKRFYRVRDVQVHEPGEHRMEHGQV